jgi:hypothetical protein
VQYERYVVNEFLCLFEVEELGAADGGDGVQLWRVSCAEFFDAASGSGFGLRDDERIV